MESEINYSKKRWLVQTNQVWKVNLFFMLIGGCLILHFVGFMDSNFELLQVVMFFMSLLWLLISVKCPNCGRRPMLQLIKTTPITRFVQSIYMFKKCPFCNK